MSCTVRLIVRAASSGNHWGGGHFDVEIDLCKGLMTRVMAQTETSLSMQHEGIERLAGPSPQNHGLFATLDIDDGFWETAAIGNRLPESGNLQYLAVGDRDISVGNWIQFEGTMPRY